MKLQPGERKAVRKGGRTVHILQLNEDGKCDRLAKAICGDGPSEKSVRSFTRAGWYGINSDVTCKKCLAIIEARK